MRATSRRWRALAAVGIFAAGAVTAFATGYAFERNGDDPARVAGTTLAPRTYTLRDGDVAVRAEAATRCEASHEGGIQNLFCTRTPEGRHQIIFYADCVLVWPLARGPDGPPFTYGWEPRRGCR